VRRFAGPFQEGEIMRLRSIITVIVVLVIGAAALFYFYGYHNRGISADLNSMEEYTEDAATTTAVKATLALNTQLSAFDIHVETSSNTVTLTGQVPTEDDKQVTEKIVRSTKGVANVVNGLRVDAAMQAVNVEKQRVIDLEIKTAVLESIMNNAELKTQQVKVEVNNGEVKLSGSVQTSAQKTAAESVARSIANVLHVDSNTLSITNKEIGQL
jgi:hyperosmotically inducible protein